MDAVNESTERELRAATAEVEALGGALVRLWGLVLEGGGDAESVDELRARINAGMTRYALATFSMWEQAIGLDRSRLVGMTLWIGEIHIQAIRTLDSVAAIVARSLPAADRNVMLAQLRIGQIETSSRASAALAAATSPQFRRSPTAVAALLVTGGFLDAAEAPNFVWGMHAAGCEFDAVTIAEAKPAAARLVEIGELRRGDRG